MPVDIVSFWLKPFGFSDRNPTLDLPLASGGGAVAGAIGVGGPPYT